ncbi:MAG TPA: hypothetical protein VM165_16510 [Planctomycetaceae bacterium]|nr:hypothetical protein [Planctomycetaceae bacterium]
MTTKSALIATAMIAIGAIVLGLSATFAFVDPTARNANERAALLGQGMALLCLIPLGAIWILWAARFQKERERKQRP